MEPAPEPPSFEATDVEEACEADAPCSNCSGARVDILGNPCSCVERPFGNVAETLMPNSGGGGALYDAPPACSACGGATTGMKNDGTMRGAPCKVCCKVKLHHGHIAVAGSTEMPTVLEFASEEARLFVWRYKNAWCVKKSRPRPPPDAETAPPLLGGAKIPDPPKNGEWTEPELQKWRNVSHFYADACLKAREPRVRSGMPAHGKPSTATFTEKTVELGRKMEEPQAGWRPAGVGAAWGEAEPKWGSWSPSWGQKPLPRSFSLPTLRRGAPSTKPKRTAAVKFKELGGGKSETAKKEMRFVARAMNDGTAKVEPPVSLESAMAARLNEKWKASKPALPVAIRDLIGKGDVLFEPPSDECSTMAGGSIMSVPMTSWEDSTSALRDDSRSALRDDSRSFLHDSSCDTVHLPVLSPKAKPVKAASQASSPPAPEKESRASAEKRRNRELVHATWKLQQQLAPVKVSIGHMLL